MRWAAVEELLQWCEGEGVRARRVAVDYASHSVQVEADPGVSLRRLLAGVVAATSGVAFFSTVTGEFA